MTNSHTPMHIGRRSEDDREQTYRGHLLEEALGVLAVAVQLARDGAHRAADGVGAAQRRKHRDRPLLLAARPSVLLHTR